MITNNSINTHKITFSAYPSSSIDNVTGDGTIYKVIFDSTLINDNSNFDTVNGEYNIPVTGNYLVSAVIAFSGLISSHTDCIVQLAIDGVATYDIFKANPYAMAIGTIAVLNCSTLLIPLTQGTKLSLLVTVSNGPKSVAINTSCRFAAQFIL